MKKLINNIREYIPIEFKFINKIIKAGGRVFLVGGAPRDIILGNKPSDFDFSIVGITDEKFQDLFPAAEAIGNSFEIFKYQGHDFSINRGKLAESAISKESNVSYKKLIEDDLKTRDFTINALAIDLTDSLLIDPYNGVSDIKKGIIKALPEAFIKDPLRVYRACRFVCELSDAVNGHFYIENETRNKMKRVKSSLNSIFPERVFYELRRALNSNFPQRFFKELNKSKILKIHFPEIENLQGIPQPKKYHPEGDVYNHTLQCLKVSVGETDNEVVRFGVLVHDLGKILTPIDELPHHYNHEQRGITLLKDLCQRLKLPTKWKKAGKLAITEHLKGYIWAEMRPGKIVRMLKKARKSPIGVKGLKKIVFCDRKGRGKKEADMSKIEKMDKFAEKLFSEVDASSIKNISEGPELGEAIFQKRCRWVKKNLDRYIEG